MEGKVSEAKAELDKMTHEWVDQLRPDWRASVESGHNPFTAEQADAVAKFNKYQELRKAVDSEPPDTSPRATSYYRSISPFDTTKYPVVRVDVVLPNAKRTTKEIQSSTGGIKLKSPNAFETDLWSPDNLHENLPNTLGWAMVQFVPDPRTGETVMFVGEQQSRWGQTAQKQQKELANRLAQFDKTAYFDKVSGEVRYEFDGARTYVQTDATTDSAALAEAKNKITNAVKQNDAPFHPLLPLQHVLVLKAAIAEARKHGQLSQQDADRLSSSVVKEPVFHQTPYSFNSNEIRPWSHFGTKEQASNVWENFKKDVWDGEPNPKLTTHEVYLDIKNPLRLTDNDDMGTTSDGWAWKAAQELKKQGQTVPEYPDTENMLAVMRKAGYDGIVYDNGAEGKGDSYIILDSKQVIPKPQGVTKMVVSDGETAMMTEGHDKHAELVTQDTIPHGELMLKDKSGVSLRLNRVFGETGKMKAEFLAGATNRKEIVAFDQLGLTFNYDQVVKLTEFIRRPETGLLHAPSQDKGMRLHYDTTLQSAMRSLTGDKGEKVEMGVHKNAVPSTGEVPVTQGESAFGTEADARAWAGPDGEVRQGDSEMWFGTRKQPAPPGSPVFRNPDGTPKSSVTGTAYDLTSAHAKLAEQGGFTLTRPNAALPIAEAEGLSTEAKAFVNRYKLGEDGLTVAKNLAEVTHNPLYKDLISDWATRFPDILRRTFTKYSKEFTANSRSNDDHVSVIRMTDSSFANIATTESHLVHELAHAIKDHAIDRPENSATVAALEKIRQLLISELPEDVRKAFMTAVRTDWFYKEISEGRDGRFMEKFFPKKMSPIEQERMNQYLYALTNKYEFTSEAMDATELTRRLLEKKREGLFGKVKNFIKQLFGYDEKAGTAHDEVLGHIEQLVESSNSVAKAFDYLETHFQDRGKTWDEANALASDTVDFMNMHGIEPQSPAEMFKSLFYLPTTSGGKEFTQAKRSLAALVGAKKENFDRLSTVLGAPADLRQVDNWLFSRLQGDGNAQELEFMPTPALDYITSRARNMRDITKAVAAITHKANDGLTNLLAPEAMRGTVKEMTQRLNEIIAHERERAVATEQADAMMSFLPDRMLTNFARPGNIQDEVKAVVDDPKGISTWWFNTANQLARTSNLFREWLVGMLGHETQARHAAVESNKVFGLAIGPDGKVSDTFDPEVGNNRMKWLAKGSSLLNKLTGRGTPGMNAKVVDALIDLNQREGLNKAEVLPQSHPEVAKILSRLPNVEDRAKAMEFVQLISHGNKVSQAATVEHMFKEAALYGAQAVLLGSKDVPVTVQRAVEMSDAVVRGLAEVKKDPSKAVTFQSVLGGAQKEMSPQAFDFLLKLADRKAGDINEVANHFAKNPGWVSAKRYRKFLFNYRDADGELITESAADKGEAQRIAGTAKVENFRPNTPGEFVQFGPKNTALGERLSQSDDFVKSTLESMGASQEMLDFLSSQGTGVQWQRDNQMNYNVGKVPNRTARTLGRIGDSFPWTENYFHWTDANAGYWSRRLTRTLAETLMQAPEYKADPELIKTIRQHVDGFLSPDPELAKKVTKATALWNLGFQVASPIMNSFQPIFRGIPEIMRLPGVGWFKATKLVAEAMKDFVKHKFAGKGDWTTTLSPEEQEFMARLTKDGVIDKSTFDEHFAQQSSYGQNMINAYQGKLLVKPLGDTLQTPTGALANVSMGLFKQTEVANNSVTALAAYRAARQLSPEKGVEWAYQQATDINRAVNDTGGRTNRMIAPFSEGGKAPRSLAMIMSSMQSYNIGSVNQLIRHFKDGWRNSSLTPGEKFAARKAFGAQLGMQFAAAGLLGLPFASSILAVINQAYPELEVNKKARELVNGFLASDAEAGSAWTDMAMTGVPSMFGWDLQSRLSSGNILPGVSEWNGFQPEQLLGVPVSNLLGFAKGAKQTLAGDAHGALAFVPPAFRKMAELIQEDGKILDYKNRPVVDDLTPGEKAGVVMGFQPKRVSDFNAAQRMAKQSEEVDAKRKAQFREQMAEEVLKGNFGTVRSKLTAMSSADPNFNPVVEVRSIAQAAEGQTFPQDLRRSTSGDARSKLLSLWNLPASQPTEATRLQFRQKVEQQLGVAPTASGRAQVTAQLMDSLRLSNPSLTRAELTQLAQRQLGRVRPRTLIEPEE